MKTKVCTGCKEVKALSLFGKTVIKGEACREYRCKTCRSARDKIVRAARSPEKRASDIKYHRDAVTRYHRSNNEKVLAYLRQNPCADCKIDNVLLLEFDHVRGRKLFDISTQRRQRSWPILKKEIDKCDVVCCNCHRIRTVTRQKVCWRNVPRCINKSSK